MLGGQIGIAAPAGFRDDVAPPNRVGCGRPRNQLAFSARRHPTMEGIIMRRLSNVCLYASVVLAAFTAVGCGSSEDGSVTASITGEETSGTPAGHGRKSKFDNVHPQLVIRTSAGDITAELDGEKAPLTVANFLSYAERHHYDHSI